MSEREEEIVAEAIRERCAWATATMSKAAARAALSASRPLILEEAAKVADEMAINRARVSDVAEHACKSIARRIRSLSHPDKEKGDE
jgi:hypothetical protein